MATVFANFAFDYRSINMNILISNQTDFEFHDNVNEVYNGRTYQDVAVFEYYDDGYLYGFFGGNNVEFNDNYTDVLSGTATGYLQQYWSGTSWVPIWGVEGFSYSAAKLADAILSRNTSDDFAVVRAILAGNDNIMMSSYDDIVRGYAGNDTIRGNAGADYLYGDAGVDSIFGGGGSDHLFGNDGNDRFVSGTGKDFITGGAGADIFEFNAVAESGTSSGRDSIMDFVHLSDKIDLQSIDANTSKAGDQAFTFAKGSDFPDSFSGAGILFYETSTGILWGNNDTDPQADFSILISNKAGLTAADFIL